MSMCSISTRDLVHSMRITLILYDYSGKIHQIGGQQVSIISHVEVLKERIRTQIRVERVDTSKSKVTIVEK